MVSAGAAETPWWEQGKTRWFWGQWSRFESGADPAKRASVEEVMRNLRAVGATVFVSDGGELDRQLERAAVARQHGLKYLCMFKVCENRVIAEKAGARPAVNRYGRTSLEEQAKGMRFDFGALVPCPLDEKTADGWLLRPALQAATSGVVDGVQIDWESYGATAYDQTGEYLCYCDSCFAAFSAAKGLTESVPRAERYDWLKRNGLHREYLGQRRDALTALYRRVAEQVREVKPDFVFAAYPFFSPGEWETSWREEGAALGLHSASAPFFLIDASHYGPNRSVPWWETSYARIRALGIRHILGSWTGTWFGNAPEMEVGASQWMYEAAMSHDGYWVWFEHRFGPTDYRAFRAADREIAAVEAKAGELLTKGTQERGFVSLVEPSGDPDLAQRLQQRTYHLGDRHLLWVFNTNTESSVDVLARFPVLPEGQRWSVTDLRGGLSYTLNGNRVWSREELAGGLLLSLGKRSDAWVLIEPFAAERSSAAGAIAGDIIPSHPARQAGDQASAVVAAPLEGFPVVYTKQNQRELYRGGSEESINPVSGTSLHAIDASSGKSVDVKLFDVDGYVRTPVLSADRRRVAFSCWVNGRGQIYVVDAAGTGLRNLSANGYRDAWPVWSPDGGRIAFISDRDGYWGLYVMSADGSGQRKLSGGPGEVRHPAWSPDGQQIAFVSDRAGDFGLYVMGADGAGERLLLSRAGNVYEPAWSPDGSKIACTVSVYGCNRDIMVLDARSGDSRDYPMGLTAAVRGWPAYTTIRSIRWSPDGTRIAGAFERGASWVDSAEGTAGVFVASLRHERAEAVVVVPGQVVEKSVESAGLTEVVSVEPDKLKPGKSVARYKLVGGWYWGGDAARHWLTRQFDAVAWSPDGKRIVFRSDLDPSGYEFLYTIRDDGTGLTRIDGSQNPGSPRDALPPAAGEKASVATNRREGDSPLLSRSFDGRDYQALLPVLREVAVLPVEGWTFTADAEGVGSERGYWKPDFSVEGMPAVRVDRYWDDQGQPKLKEGWYRLRYRVPEAPGGKRLFLRFGAIDESAWLYVDGTLTAWYNPLNPDQTWDKPVLLEVSGSLHPGAEHLLVVRVTNAAGAGGLWKPLALLSAD
jgi:Tol biopolymer transport system component